MTSSTPTTPQPLTDFKLSISAVSDVGRERSNNEDSHGHTWLSDGSLFVIVADGMGGHEAGEVASGLAVQVIEEVVARDPDDDPRKRLYESLLEANQAIIEEGTRSGTRGMGTTAVCAVLRGQEVYVGLVGDSRCYHIRRGQLLWRTLDHTRVQMLVDNGAISDEEARTHPESGMLTRALGHERMADGRPLEPDVLAEPLWLEASDSLLLCTDGLHDLVEDWEIGQMIAGRTPEEAARILVQTACDRGGHDNVTVAVISAGPRAAAYDPNYVPEYYREIGELDDFSNPDDDTYDTYDDPSGDPSHALAVSPYTPPPTGQGFAEVTMDLPRPTPGRRKWMVAAALFTVLLSTFLLIVGILGVIAYFRIGDTSH